MKYDICKQFFTPEIVFPAAVAFFVGQVCGVSHSPACPLPSPESPGLLSPDSVAASPPSCFLVTDEADVAITEPDVL